MAAGQSIAVVGPSACGKTTIGKIILGLLKPTEGEVHVVDIPMTQFGIKTHRPLIGKVMQEDVLLAGSIMDNLAVFDGQCDQQRAQECARLAAIHDDISKMPMGYQTLVGDMGSSLSGGQKQRVLLARALYKQPKILSLDEATSHLDVNNEHKLDQALGNLQLTRIMVAHRPETINAAERVVSLADGAVVELRAAVLKEDGASLKLA
ncbi:ATP-binding cassette domain-containing protein [Undibacterium sp. Ji42W]|uniref:ATP-binding cassette domain-containing protein n=1 Tax=Undibacterium sp. Ji42W TaxID=3413039 RepID=UPI003BEF80E9